MYGEFVELQHGGVYTYSASIKSSVNINMSSYYPLNYVINTDKGLTHDVNLYEILNVSHSVVNANNWVQVYITFKVLYNTNSKVYFQPWVY